MTVYYIDGSYVDAEQAVLPISDLAILRGYAVFDFLRTYGGRPFHLDAHLFRLLNSARLIELDCPWKPEAIKEIVEETLARNNFQESSIRLIITGGDSDDFITPGGRPRLVVMANPLKNYPANWYSEGVKVLTTNITRHVPGAKSIDYIQAILALKKARANGAVESLYVDRREYVLEATTSNFFAVIGGSLTTPRDGILPGVTRDVVLDLAGPVYHPSLQPISRADLYRADEVFLTSSNKEVVPVRQIDDRIIGPGRPGPVTGKIMELFHSYTRKFLRDARNGAGSREPRS